MVLKRGRFGQFMACTGYPDCKTTRRLDQGKRVPDIPLEETCPKCGRNLMIRHGRYGEFTACSGYPDCKYVKQNFIGVKCPDCEDGELVEKRARKGNTFYGCSQLSEVQIHFGEQADCRKMPELRTRVPGREAEERRCGDCVSEQGMRLRATGAARSAICIVVFQIYAGEVECRNERQLLMRN